MQSNNCQNTSMDKPFSLVNVVPGVTDHLNINQNMNLIQLQDNLPMITRNSNLQSNSSNASSSLVNSFNRTRCLQSNSIPNINLNYNNSFENFGNINNVIQLNNDSKHNIYQQQCPNTNPFISHNLNSNINQNQMKYANIKNILASNQSLPLNSNFHGNPPQTSNLNQNSISNSKFVNSDTPILHPLIPVPYFTFELFNKVNLNSPFSQENNGYDLPFSDITSLRFFYNFGIQQFKNMVNKQPTVKSNEISGEKLNQLLQQHSFNGNQVTSNNDIKAKLGENSFTKNSNFSMFPGTSNNINIPGPLNNINLSNNLYRNNLPLDNQVNLSIDSKEFSKLLQHQKMLVQDIPNIQQQQHNSLIQNSSLASSYKQNSVSDLQNVAQSQQIVLNELLYNANISQNQPLMTGSQSLTNRIIERLSKTIVKENHINDKIDGSTNPKMITSEKVIKNLKLVEVKEGEGNITCTTKNNQPINKNILEDKPSTHSSSIFENLKVTNSTNNFNIHKINNKDNEVTYLLNKTNGNMHEFTKKIPVCVFRKVFNIVKILNDNDKKKFTPEVNDNKIHILEEYEDTVTYQEELLEVKRNHLLHLKIHKHGVLNNKSKSELLKIKSSLLETKEVGSDLSLEVINNKISGPFKRRRESFFEGVSSSINLNESDNNFSIQSDVIEDSGIKRFKKSNPENDEMDSKDLNHTTSIELARESKSLTHNNVTSLIPSNNLQKLDSSTVTYSNEKYFITEMKDNTCKNINSQLTFNELYNANSEKENKDIKNFSTKSSFLDKKFFTSVNISDFIISPFIENYLTYFKNELFRFSKKEKKKDSHDSTLVTSSGLPIVKPFENPVVTSKPNNLHKKNSFKVLENGIDGITKNDKSLEGIPNVFNFHDLTKINSNILQYNSLPINLPESFGGGYKLQAQNHSEIAFWRTTELEELLNQKLTN
ncbi:Hypothetical protein SRAE_1000220000 [Strongyloides ratti]|uniref:Uncharacterized protein n=1 Tax=Strongyloides ratti TaxID=34506 RepID=A0A090MWM5_STRRB|nr:Hypothetical protein SRAE_1000220000 [Strongyloides ratti]CEF63944.1 Hypothetical protein SRAE_1000220000 [Strongyloides ratti]